MSSADSFRGRNPNKFTGESHAKSRQKAWNPRLWIKPCKYTLHHCTVTYLAPREKQMPKTLQQLRHLQSLPPLWRHLCCSCQGKLARKRHPLVSSEYRRQTNLKMFFAVYYFFAQHYQYKKRWWPSHTHSPYTASMTLVNPNVYVKRTHSWPFLVQVWNLPSKLYRKFLSRKKHMVSNLTPWQLRRAHSPFSLTENQTSPKSTTWRSSGTHKSATQRIGSSAVVYRRETGRGYLDTK